MNTIKILVFNAVLFFTIVFMSSLSAMEAFASKPNVQPNIQLGQAMRQDLDGVVDLINKHVARDAQDSIVTVPEKFRRDAIASIINDKKLFIARAAGVLVGLKKLYVEHDYKKVQEMLNSELRVNRDNLQVEGSFGASGQFKECPIDSAEYSYEPGDIYVYTGLDYTRPDYRGHYHINGQLYEHAFDALKDGILEHAKKARRIHMMYGLVEKNGPALGIQGRTVPILKAFQKFLQKSGIKFTPSHEIVFRSYQAYMPQFDPKADELKPLPDSASIKGSGCLLTYKLPCEGAHA